MFAYEIGVYTNIVYCKGREGLGRRRCDELLPPRLESRRRIGWSLNNSHSDPTDFVLEPQEVKVSEDVWMT